VTTDPFQAVADAHRRDWAAVLSATVRVTRNIDLAEECVQDAYARALAAWPADGIPAKPGAWLTTVARRRAVDLLRRERAFRERLPLLVGDYPPDSDNAEGGFPDDRLRLIFTCSHPALSLEARVALTLRLVCGLTTAEVGRAFLVTESTMAARLTRAKKKIHAARIPYRIPTTADMPERLTAVLAVTHLVFTTGHTAPVGTQLVRTDLVERAVELARMLHAMLPHELEVSGLLALVLLTDARRAARLADDGSLVRLEDQDRSRWDRASIDEGLTLVRVALRQQQPGRFTLMAAIAAVHAEAAAWGETNWPAIVRLYDRLLAGWPSPVVELNRAVALRFAYGPEDGLAALDQLRDEPQLVGYGYFAAARAEMLRDVGRIAEARQAYDEAILLTANEVEASFLRQRRRELG